MVKHFIRITAITLLLVLCMFYPFIPGDYDSLAVTLSFMTQVSGMTGLVLVPIGIIWLIYEAVKQKKKNWQHTNKSFHFAITALIASCIVALATSLVAFADKHRSFGMITLIIFIYIFSKIVAKLRQTRQVENNSFNPTPFYLIFIPTVVVLIRFMFIIHASEYSRNYAIKQSEELIKDIEAYYTKNGSYPSSLLSVWTDYNTSVTGIKQFYYELNGSAYNLYFEQFSSQLDIREIVMYNKLDEHQMTSHDMDLLMLSPEDLNRQRGYIGVYDLPQRHWKYFWFD